MNIKRLIEILRHPRAFRVSEIKLRNILGKNSDNIYYIIRTDLPNCGLFAIFMYVLEHVAYAKEHGYIPVVYSKGYSCLYKEKGKILDTKEPWRYYFEQTAEIDIRDCWKHRNLILGEIRFLRHKGLYYYAQKEKNMLPTKERISELYDLVEKYIKFRPELIEELNQKLNMISKKRILGVHVRGTDMCTAGRQHPIPTGETKDFTRIDKIMREYNLDCIFLCTDSEETVHLFEEYYGDRVITTDAVRQGENKECGIHFDTSLGNGRKYHKYLLGKEVITDMYLLAHCNVLVCGASNVAFAAMIYNNNKYDKIFYYV